VLECPAAQQVSRDVAEPEALAKNVKLSCRFHLTSVRRTYCANIENPTLLQTLRLPSHPVGAARVRTANHAPFRNSM